MSDSKNILVCESNAALAGMISTGLEKAGYACTVVDDGREAWEKFDAGGFDAVVTEYSLKDALGLELCRGIRQHKSLGSTVLFVTFESEDQKAQVEEELKLEGALKKPVSVKGLVSQMQTALPG